MGYLSFDASVKISANGDWHSSKNGGSSGTGGVRGFAHHLGRHLDRLNGIEVMHGNQDINADMTEYNECYIKDADGNWCEAEHSQDIAEAVERRIDYIKSKSTKTMRSDAVIVRCIVTEVTDDCYDEEQEEDLIKAQADYMNKRFGNENVVGMAVHQDEANLHIHWLVVPGCELVKRELLQKNPVVDKDTGKPVLDKNGKPKIKKVYSKGTPTGEMTLNQHELGLDNLPAIHKDFRKYLRDKGFDISLENKPPEEYLASYTDKKGNVHQKGLTPEQLKEIKKVKQDARDERALARAESQGLEREKKRLDKRENALKAREDALKAREDDLKQKEDNLSIERKNCLETRNTALSMIDHHRKAKEECEKREEEARKAKEEADRRKNAYEQAERATKEYVVYLKQNEPLVAKELAKKKETQERYERRVKAANAISAGCEANYNSDRQQYGLGY